MHRPTLGTNPAIGKHRRISNSENLTHQFLIYNLDRDRGCNPCVINHLNTAPVTSSLAWAMIQCPLPGSAISSSFGIVSLILGSTVAVVAVGSFPPQMCSTGNVAGRCPGNSA